MTDNKAGYWLMGQFFTPDEISQSPKNNKWKWIVVAIVALVLLVASIRACAQSTPFEITFTKAYLGTYDRATKAVQTLQWDTQIRSIDASFDGSTLITIFNRSVGTDTLSLVLNLQSETAGDDFVEYKFQSIDGYLVFLRYNRYYIQGIFELSIFAPDIDRFIYIKKKKNTVETNTTSHE